MRERIFGQSFASVKGMVLVFFILSFLALIILLIGFFEIKLPFISRRSLPKKKGAEYIMPIRKGAALGTQSIG